MEKIDSHIANTVPSETHGIDLDDEIDSEEYVQSSRGVSAEGFNSPFARRFRRNDFIVRGLMSVLHNVGVPIDFEAVSCHLVSELNDSNWSRRPVVRPKNLGSRLHDPDPPETISPINLTSSSLSSKTDTISRHPPSLES